MKKIFENHKAISIFVLLISLFVYLYSQNQELTYTDNGELAAACIKLGIAHPTGYPLFTIIGHLWSLIPLPFSKIYSMNLLAGVYTSLASFVLFFILKLILEKISFTTKTVTSVKKKKQEVSISKEGLNLQPYMVNIISGLLAISFSFAETVWAQANSLEVYSFQILLMNLTIFSILKAYYSEAQRKFYVLTAFLFGLAMTNHMTSILMFPSLVWLFFLDGNDKLTFNKKRLNELFLMAIPVLLALSIYLYLPIRSSMLPEVNWGWVHRGFDKFLYHLQGKQYQIWMFSGSEVIFKNLGIYLTILPYQLGLFGLIPAFWGIFISRKSRPLFWFLLMLIFFNIAYAVNYSIFDINSYFILSFIALFIFAAIGLAHLVKRNKNWLILGIFILLVNFFVNFSANDHSEDFFVEEYTNNMINSFEKDAIVISAQWDYFVAPFLYKQTVENIRPDIVLVEKELLRRTWYPNQFKLMYPEVYDQNKTAFQDFESILEKFESDLPYIPEEIQKRFEDVFTSIIENNIDKRPIYITIDVLQTEEYFKKFTIAPQGFALRILPKDTTLNINLAKLKLNYFLNAKGMYDNILPNNLTLLVADNLANLALYSYNMNQKEKTKYLVQNVLRINPEHQLALQLQQNLK
jgi:hypothetical protein